MAKILLINPPMLSEGKCLDEYKGNRPFLPPLGLAYIASVLENNGHKVEIFDGAIEEKTMEQLGNMAQSFDKVGITATTFIALQMHKVAEAIKSKGKDIPIIAGGAHPSVATNDVLADKNIDFVAIGEAEYTMLDFANGEKPQNIKGIAYKKEEQLIFTKERPLLKNLDELPLPSRHLLKMERYRASDLRTRKHPALHLMSSRGCPSNCSFCSNNILHRRCLRVHSAERVIEEMKLLIEKYGARELHFWDDNLAFYKERLLKICELIKKEKIDIPWNCESRVDTIDTERLNALKSAGCYQINYGLESGSERILKSVNKNISLEQIKTAIKLTNKAGIETRGYFMFGFVGETLEEMEQTIKFAKELDLDYATFSTLVPLPGSLDYERAQKSGTFDKDYWKKGIITEISFPKESVYVPEGITSEQLIAMHRKAINEFYARPSQIIKKFKKVRSFEDIKRLWRGGLTLIKH